MRSWAASTDPMVGGYSFPRQFSLTSSRLLLGDFSNRLREQAIQSNGLQLQSTWVNQPIRTVFLRNDRWSALAWSRDPLNECL